MLIAAFFANFQAVLVKSLDGLKTSQIFFVRSVIVILICVSYLTLADRFNEIVNSFNLRMVSIGLTGGLGLCLFYYSLNFLPLSEAVVIYFAIAFFNGIIARIFLKEKYTAREKFMGIINIVGVLLIARPRVVFHEEEVDISEEKFMTDNVSHSSAAVLCFVSTAFASGSQVLIRSMDKERDPNIPVIYINLAIFVFTSARIWISGFTIGITFYEFLGAFAVAVANVVGMYFSVRALRLEKPSVIGIVTYSQLIYSLIWDFLLFDEIPSWYTVIGTGLILGSCILLIFLKEKR